MAWSRTRSNAASNPTVFGEKLTQNLPSLIICSPDISIAPGVSGLYGSLAHTGQRRRPGMRRDGQRSGRWPSLTVTSLEGRCFAYARFAQCVMHRLVWWAKFAKWQLDKNLPPQGSRLLSYADSAAYYCVGACLERP